MGHAKCGSHLDLLPQLCRDVGCSVAAVVPRTPDIPLCILHIMLDTESVSSVAPTVSEFGKQSLF
jgi:hypothetical protein